MARTPKSAAEQALSRHQRELMKQGIMTMAWRGWDARLSLHSEALGGEPGNMKAAHIEFDENGNARLILYGLTEKQIAKLVVDVKEGK